MMTVSLNTWAYEGHFTSKPQLQRTFEEKNQFFYKMSKTILNQEEAKKDLHHPMIRVPHSSELHVYWSFELCDVYLEQVCLC